MMIRSSSCKFQPIIVDAADLLLKCSGYLHDRYAAEREDEHYIETYYAIDNDIIKLYLEPESKTQYLSLFGEDANSDTTKSLTFLLGDFLFRSSVPLVRGHEKQKSRFLIIPPHDEELLRLLNAIHRNLTSASDAVHQALFDSLSDIFVQFDETNDAEALLDRLEQHVPELVELFNPHSGPRAALSRFALLADTVFQRIDTYLEDTFTFPLLDASANHDDRVIADELIDKWKKLLKKAAPRNKPEYAIFRDAEVLATIDHVNTNLSGMNKQVVLISGTNHLFEAAETYKPWGEDQYSFAEKYLRHPQAFLSHPNFFTLSDHDSTMKITSIESERPFVLSEWLSLFFPSALRPAIQQQTTVIHNFLRSIKRPKKTGFNTFFHLISNTSSNLNPEDLIDSWNDQVLSVAKMKYSGGLDLAGKRGATELAQCLIDLRGNSEWSVEYLREMIRKESITATSALYSMTAFLIGIWSKATRKVSKGIPVLRLDGEYRVIEEYCDRLVMILLANTEKSISKTDSEELYALNKAVESKDKDLYHAHLVHSLAFMVKGHWNASLTLAKIALAISDNLDASVRGVRRGREAAYLACIAARRSVSDRSSLETAYKYLDEAIRREEPGSPEDIRFKVERLMLDVRCYYFELFCEEKILDISNVTNTVQKLYCLFLDSKNEDNERVKLWVQRQILTHFFTLLFILRDANDIDIIVNKIDILACVSHYEDLIKRFGSHYHKPEDDPYATLVSNISIAIWSTDNNERISKKEIGLKYISDINPSSPYDSSRIELLKRCLNSLNID